MLRNAAAPWRRARRGLLLLLSCALCATAGAAVAQDADEDGVDDLLEDRNGNGFQDDDSDGDGLYDYLDDDDDGDGFLTLEEDWNGNGDPLDDDQGGYVDLPDFLDPLTPLDDDGDDYIDPTWGGDDCDDTSASWHPGASDQWYDDRDTDCAGNSDFDQDADGADNTGRGGGDDCDDRNGLAYPGAVEDPGGADLDCDGFADPVHPVVANGGCDCAASGAAVGAPWWVLGALVAARRRGR